MKSLQETREFKPESHLYLFDGRPIPSVTQCLASVGLLPDFRMVKRSVLERKRQIGIALHSCLHYLQQGDLDLTSVDPEVKPRLEAYQLFVQDTGFKPIGCEFRNWPVVHGMQYGMCADVTGIIKKEPWLIDFKCAEGKPHYGWAIQLQAYSEGIKAPLVPPFRWRRMSLQLLENGKYQKREWDDTGDKQEWISSLYLVYRRINRGETPWIEKLAE